MKTRRGVIAKISNFLVNTLRWIGMFLVFLLMIFIFVAVVGRTFRHPIVGDVEIVQYAMLILIACSLSYTQVKHGHITIGLFVDHFPPRLQKAIDIIGLTLTVLVSWIITYGFINSVQVQYTQFYTRSLLLRMPDVLFRGWIALGFFTWGLTALSQTFVAVQEFAKGDFTSNKYEEGKIL
jgi:TRAP-type C4-dicarboxylate transport system permease small subunit